MCCPVDLSFQWAADISTSARVIYPGSQRVPPIQQQQTDHWSQHHLHRECVDISGNFIDQPDQVMPSAVGQIEAPGSILSWEQSLNINTERYGHSYMEQKKNQEDEERNWQSEDRDWALTLNIQVIPGKSVSPDPSFFICKMRGLRRSYGYNLLQNLILSLDSSRLRCSFHGHTVQYGSH